MTDSGFTIAQLRYVTGDATLPEGAGPRVIAHVCNNRGGYGAGFALAIANRYPQARNEYKRQIDRLHLGDCQCIRVADGLWVANLIAQDGYATAWHKMPLRYDSLAECLHGLEQHCEKHSASVHCPRMGTGLGGADWREVSVLLLKYLVAHGTSVTVYDLEKK